LHDIKRFFRPPTRSYFFLGPRGTGKTTFLEDHYKGAPRIDLLKADIERLYAAKPERLIEFVEGHPNATTFVIDEIQRVPTLLAVVHRLIFDNKKMQFILTGSSARKIKRAGVDLLGGRASERTFHPFMAAELGKKFSLEKAMQFGMLPLLYHEEDPKDVLDSYISLYIREEVKTEGLVRNVDDFSRFIESMSFSHGSFLNATNISRDCAVNRKTVENYIGILEDLLLSFQLEVFAKKAKRDLISHRKFYFFDAGVFRSIRPKGPLDNQSELNGPVLEGLVAQHLRAWCDYSEGGNKLYFWHTRSGLEVDFVIYGEKHFLAIEVKNSARVDPRDLKGLAAFSQDYPEAKAIFLYRGKERLKVQGVLCIPVEEFLLDLIPNEILKS
jgi:predicted AAA+ superfamily ATPase